MDAVEVWRCSLTSPAWAWPAMAAWLDDEERTRLRTMGSARDRRRFLAAHGQLRGVLAHCLDVPPECLRFERSVHGKPRLAGAHAQSVVHFNLSHSEDEALIAVSRQAPVGVDVEHRRPGIRWRGMARRFFGADDVLRLERLSDADAEREFYRIWVQVEAGVKALGQPVMSAFRGGDDAASTIASVLLLNRPVDAPACVALAAGDYCDQ